MKIKLDCPLCHVFMSPVGKSPLRGVPSYFICPVCNSMFSPHMHPDKSEWITAKIREHKN